MLVALLAVVAVALLGTVVMLLWNAIVPGITGWAALTWPKAVGLLVLCRLLFGGFKGRPGAGRWGRWRSPVDGGDPRSGEGWRMRCRGMSDEQRQRLKEEWERRCGGFRGRSRGWTEALPVPVRAEHRGRADGLHATLHRTRMAHRAAPAAVPAPLRSGRSRAFPRRRRRADVSVG